LATRLVKSLFCSTFLSAFSIQVSSIITPVGLLSLNKHQRSQRECPRIPHAKYLDVGFLQDVSLSTSIPALFKHLLRAKAFPLYKPLVVLEWFLMAYSVKSVLKVLPLIVALAFSKGILSPSYNSFATLRYLEDLNFYGLFNLVLYFI